MMRYLRLLLLPFSAIYGIAVWLRNCFYNWGWLRQTAFDIPVIVVGNLAVGGTGKSPMTEYLIRLLAAKYRIATLSRGYGRKTQGFREVQPTDTVAESGDEPLQFKRKFPEITVAVCEDRVTGVQWLQRSGHQVVLLDDAFQHRALKPGLAILLFDYPRIHKPRWLLPAGDYRDWFAARRRADILIVTKTPDTVTKAAKTVQQQQLAVGHKPMPILFAGIDYGELRPVRPGVPAAVHNADVVVLLVTGIARPDPIYRYLATSTREVIHMRYPDHHAYTAADMARISQRFSEIQHPRKIIVTTEKDCQRLVIPAFYEVLEDLPVYMLPIRFTFDRNDEAILRQKVLEYCAAVGPSA